MWLMTTSGFYSVVQHRDDPLTMLVRARSREDLERLCELSSRVVYPPEQGGWPSKEMIRDTPKPADYPHRIYMPRTMWLNVQTELSDAVDYDNFKDAVKKEIGPERASIYMGVWGRLIAIEREGREAEDGWSQMEWDIEWPTLDDDVICDHCGEPIDPVDRDADLMGYECGNCARG